MYESGNGSGNESGKRSGKRDVVLRKTYEIAYAVFRIASRTGSAALREHLERQALSLLDAAAVENYGWIDIVSKAIDYLMRFGGDVGLIHEANKATILEQLGELSAYVAGPEKAAKAEEIPLDDIFFGQEQLFHPEPLKRQPAVPAAPSEPVMVNVPAIETPEMPERPAMPFEQFAQENNQAIRQSAILEKIRQSGNCRLRDLVAVLPDYSERTIRYDLETLAAQNLVERIGNGGPAVAYRIRQGA